MSTEFSWLIESSGPFYLGARHLGVHEFYWTKDANAAIRFRDFDAADGVMMAIRDLKRSLFDFPTPLDARPVQHGFIDVAANN